MATHKLTVHLGLAGNDPDTKIQLDGVDITPRLRALEFRAGVGELSRATLVMLPNEIEAADLPADVVVQPIKVETEIVHEVRMLTISECRAKLVDAGYVITGPYDVADPMSMLSCLPGSMKDLGPRNRYNCGSWWTRLMVRLFGAPVRRAGLQGSGSAARS
ncbi:MAG: hypothetical protein ABFD60_01715 [Bryobacteraceae bacterium]